MKFNKPLDSIWMPLGMHGKHIAATKETHYIPLEVLLGTILNYSICYYELLVFVYFVNTQKQYLLRKETIIYSDHKPLEFNPHAKQE